MSEIVGIRFKQVGKIYYFSPNGIEFKIGDGAIVETARGVEFGKVVIANREEAEENIIKPLKPVLRKATDEDVDIVLKNNSKRAEAIKICEQKIKNRGLEMKLVDAEYTFDGEKIIFYFTADGRVDFRELVRDLASVFKLRIELRQIGIRDESKIIGGIAPCGRGCCCATFLGDFEKVSIKMAKTQGLSLNPTKISGLCGRLMCCLAYENDHYAETVKLMPKVGAEVITPDGKGINLANDLLKRTVKVKITNGEETIIKDFPLKDVKFKDKMKVDDVKTEEKLDDILD